MSECPTSGQLREMSLGLLSNAESDVLLEHADNCPACQAEMETVSDAEDSLVTSLRNPGSLESFRSEPTCERAVAKALGALAVAEEQDSTKDTPLWIGEYEIVQPLGHGGMGNVFLARQSKLGRDVAIKMLSNRRLGDRKVAERFESEMRAIGQLSHPNIVTAFDAREVDGIAVLVTEYVDGFDLGKLLNRTGPLSVANGCEIVRNVAVALEYVASKGLVHRDVKPSNVMLSKNGDVKLLDLGLARLEFDEVAEGLTGTGQALGTADFISPEQIRDSRRVDIRADIYSLGCTLYKLLTGIGPFEGDEFPNAFAKMTAHVSTPAASLAQVLPGAPADLVALVDSMLAKQPSSRPQSPIEVAKRLERFASASSVAELIALAEQDKPLVRASPKSPSLTRSQPRGNRRFTFPSLITTGILIAILGFVLTNVMKTTRLNGLAVSKQRPVKDESDPSGPRSTTRNRADQEVTVEAPKELSPQTSAETPITRDRSGSSRPRSITKNRADRDVTVEAAKRQSRNISSVTPATKTLLSEYVEMPLFFGVLANAGMKPLHDLASKLPRNPDGTWKEADGTPIVAGGRLWLAVRDGVKIPRHDLPPNYDYAVLEEVDTSRVSLQSLNAKTLTIRQLNAKSIEFQFEPELTEQIRKLSIDFPGQRIAIIVGGQIAAAPLLAEVTDQLRLNATQNDAVILANLHSQERNPAELLAGFWRVNTQTASGKTESESLPAKFVFQKSGYKFDGDDLLPRRGSFSVEERGHQKFALEFQHRSGVSKSLLWIRDDDRIWLLFGPKPSSAPVEFASTQANGNRMLELVRDLATENTHAITQGLMKYEAAYKRFPLSVNTNRAPKLPKSSDTTMPERSNAATEPYSWRVAILPFVGHQDLYERYRFDERWDSAANLKVAEEMPRFFRRPGDKPNTNSTHFMALQGADSVMGNSKGMSLGDIEDGTSHTILFVEAVDSVIWTEPNDIQFDPNARQFPAELTDGGLPKVSIRVGIANGNVATLENLEWSSFKHFITPNGAEATRIPQ